MIALNWTDRPLRSVLFAPGSRPDVLAKLTRTKPDGAVIDLEDAVAPDGKPEARVHASAIGPQLVAEHPSTAFFVRINALATPFFADDVAHGLQPEFAGVVVPKIESAADVAAVAVALDAAGLSGLSIVAGIETAAGVDRANEILAAQRVEAGYFGAEDFIADMGGVRTESNAEVAYARGRCALAGRLAMVPMLDQVVANFSDTDRMSREGREARAMGYAGKLCIHPSQVALANLAFSPSAEEIAHARALLEVYEASTGVAVFDGHMIDEPLARRARAVIASADV